MTTHTADKTKAIDDLPAAKPLPKFILPEELQEALGGEAAISMRTIQRMARARVIPGAVRLGRKLVFQRQPVLAWIEGGAPGLRTN